MKQARGHNTGYRRKGEQPAAAFTSDAEWSASSLQVLPFALERQAI
jgi:hypothetical protein